VILYIAAGAPAPVPSSATDSLVSIFKSWKYSGDLSSSRVMTSRVTPLLDLQKDANDYFPLPTPLDDCGHRAML